VGGLLFARVRLGLRHHRRSQCVLSSLQLLYLAVLFPHPLPELPQASNFGQARRRAPRGRPHAVPRPPGANYEAAHHAAASEPLQLGARGLDAAGPDACHDGWQRVQQGWRWIFCFQARSPPLQISEPMGGPSKVSCTPLLITQHERRSLSQSSWPRSSEDTQSSFRFVSAASGEAGARPHRTTVAPFQYRSAADFQRWTMLMMAIASSCPWLEVAV
jgi:hypothetical protein